MKANYLLKGAAILTLAGILGQPANAQWHRDNNRGNIGNRLSEQEARIREGVASGQLTRSEAERTARERFENLV